MRNTENSPPIGRTIEGTSLFSSGYNDLSSIGKKPQTYATQTINKYTKYTSVFITFLQALCSTFQKRHLQAVGTFMYKTD